MIGIIKKYLNVDNILRFVCLFISVGYFLTGLSVFLNFYAVRVNTIRLSTDYSLVEVVGINSDSIILEDGTIVEFEDIELYSKVLKGSGDWYNFESKFLITELSNADTTDIINEYIVSVIVLLAFLCYMYFKRKDRSVLLKILIGGFSVVFVACAYFTIRLYIG